MRKSLLMSAAALGLAVGASAFAPTAMAQRTGGTGYGAGYAATGTAGPYSTQASNINGQDMRSRIAPVLPTPPGAQNASPEQLLGIAQNELRRGQTGAAQQALEMAETRALDRLTAPRMADSPRQTRWSIRSIRRCRRWAAMTAPGRCRRSSRRWPAPAAGAWPTPGWAARA